MDFPLWVPWALVVALAWPVALRRRTLTSSSAGDLLVMLLPALLMAGYATWLTIDQRSVDQDEFDAAASHAARSVGGNHGPVSTDRVATVMGDRLGREVVVTASDLTQEEVAATYSMTARLAGDDAGNADDSGPAACLTVELGPPPRSGSDLRLAVVGAESGPCADDG